MLLESFLFVVGLGLLIFCSDRIVHSASHLARHLGISEFLVGVLIVGFGTSLPELVTSVMAAIDGHTLIALGNVVGSNIANIGLIVAVAGLGGGLTLSANRFHLVEASMLVVFTVIVAVLLAVDGLHRVEAYILLGIFGVYLWFVGSRATYQMEHHRNPPHLIATGHANLHASVHLSVVLFSAFGLWLAANWVVDGVLLFSSLLGVGEGMVALTAVAIGTSLPELSVALQAARTRHPEILIGDVLGANTLNLLLVLGLSGLIAPIALSLQMLWMLPVMVAFAIMLWVFIRMGRHITRAESAILLVGYVLTLVVVGLVV